MRAFQLTEYVGPSGLEVVDLPAPEPGPLEVLVDVRVIGVTRCLTRWVTSVVVL